MGYGNYFMSAVCSVGILAAVYGTYLGGSALYSKYSAPKDIEVTEYYTQNDETKRITQEIFTEEAKKTIKASEKEAQDALAVAFVAQVAEDAAKLAAENPNQDPHMADVNTDSKLDNKNTNKTDKTDKTGKKIK